MDLLLKRYLLFSDISVSLRYLLFIDVVSARYFLFTDTLSVNIFFLEIKELCQILKGVPEILYSENPVNCLFKNHCDIFYTHYNELNLSDACIHQCDISHPT